MNNYSIDIKVTGYINVHIKANSSFAALEAAQERFEHDIMFSPIKELCDMSTQADIVNSWSLDEKSVTKNDELRELLESVITQFPDAHESLKQVVAMLAERESGK